MVIRHNRAQLDDVRVLELLDEFDFANGCHRKAIVREARGVHPDLPDGHDSACLPIMGLETSPYVPVTIISTVSYASESGGTLSLWLSERETDNRVYTSGNGSTVGRTGPRARTHRESDGVIPAIDAPPAARRSRERGLGLALSEKGPMRTERSCAARTREREKACA